MRRIGCVSLVMVSLFLCGLPLELPATEDGPGKEAAQFFQEQIEPIFQEHCFSCHSHAAGEMSSGLTLDSRSGWREGGDRGPAVMPGKPAESLLIVAVQGADPDLQMPPEGRLSADEIARLIEWVKRGAPDPRTMKVARPETRDSLDWWSLRSLQRPALPAAGPDDSEAVQAIDAFINDRLRQADLTPMAVADRRTLIKRLYVDLHGMLPDPQAISAFVSDPDPRAYEKLVDRLLQSPRYGERWARHWLDTVHFADSHGCEHDVFRPHAWRYRDYVIASFNRDTPWDRMIREQLAADHFFPENARLTAALGFIAAGPLELSRAGTAPVTFDYLDRDDMVAQTMAAFASTTANCARCHDHKFDPISQEDYYSLQAVFAGVGKGDVEFDMDPHVGQQRVYWQQMLAAATSDRSDKLFSAEYASWVAAWEAEFLKRPAAWTPLVPDTFTAVEGSTLKLLDDHSLLAVMARPEQETYLITGPIVGLNTLAAIRLDVLADDSLPQRGPGRQDNGNLHLSEFEAYLLEPGAAEPERLAIGSAEADWKQAGWTIAHAIDGNPATAWGIYPQVGMSHHAVFQLKESRPLMPGSQLRVILKQLHGGGHLIGRPQLHVTESADVVADVLPQAVHAALLIPRDERSDAQRIAVAGHALRKTAEQHLAALPPPELVYAVSSGYSHAKKLPEPMPPKVVHVLRRGQIDLPGEVAQPGALSALTSLPGRFAFDDPNDEASRRAALADWLASPDNPLTWRSVVNRVWAYHFGRGLCETTNDFGRMGGLPSHPELLDWLAVWFRDDARGSLKRLHRLILLSAAWRRQSIVTARRQGIGDASAGALERERTVDGENRLLWRMNRRRLDAETYRDAVLQIAGRIDLAMGGPGIQQFTQSPGAQATPTLDYAAFDWSRPSAARRSIYRVVWRGIADPFMESLDFPDLGILAPQRGNSVSALQALVVYNNDFVLHHSRVMAERASRDGGPLDRQIATVFQWILLREPTDREAVMLTGYAKQHGLAATCRVLLNSNEFLYVD